MWTLFSYGNERAFCATALTTGRRDKFFHKNQKDQRPLENFFAFHFWNRLRKLPDQPVAFPSLVSTGREPSHFCAHPARLWQWLGLTVCLLGRGSEKIQVIKFCHAKSSLLFQKTKPIPSIQRRGKHLWVSVTTKDKAHAHSCAQPFRIRCQSCLVHKDSRELSLCT